MTAFSEKIRSYGLRIAFVPTMGFFHDGHVKLMKEAKKHGDKVVASIFVNPAQFGKNEDFGKYPKNLERDMEIARKAGVDALFVPTSEEIYPKGFQTYVEVEKLSKILCGKFRKGHFRGVATVVLKLFNIVNPHTALFGKKDLQQLHVIRKMTEDLNLPVNIIAADTIREGDGLAMSSRNSYLKPRERKDAALIKEGLDLAKSLVQRGVLKTSTIKKAVRGHISKSSLIKIQYLEIVDSSTLSKISSINDAENCVIMTACFIGSTRLIDNLAIKGK